MAIDREKVLEAAQKLVEKKRYDRAILEYQKLIEEDPNDARTLLKIGDLQLKMEGYPDAIATYERVGRQYAQQGFALKAIAVYKQIREIVAKHVPHLEERYAHIPPKLAELYQQLGLVSDALAALDEVATRLQRQQRDQEAIEVFRKIVTLDPTNPLPHLRLAEALSRARDADGAVSEFGIAAALLIKLGRRDDALKVLERLLHHRAEPAHARMAAELYLARGGTTDGMQALSKLQICFHTNPKDLTTLDLLAKAFVQIGQPRKGIEVQKEMARIAREQKRLDVMDNVLAVLSQIAPDDDGVAQLMIARDELAVELAGEMEEEEAELIEEVEDFIEEVPEPPPSEAEPLLLRSEPPTAMMDEGPELVEQEFAPAAEPDAAVMSRLADLLGEAQSFRRVRLYAKAVEAIAAGLEIDGRSIPLRAELRDIYLEAGQPADAVVEMLNIASLQLDALDGDGAAQTLQDVLAVDPENERAAVMLRELGYEPVEEAPPPPPQDFYLPPGRARMPSYDPEAPLPSYDLDEPGFAEAPTGHTAVVDDAPLPSFPLDAPESEAQFELIPDKAPSVMPPEMPSEAATAAYAKPTSEEIEEALEEADFFASRGLFEDAKAVISDQLSRNPSHKLLLERMAEIEAQEQAAQRGSGTRARPDATSPVAPIPDEDFDISSSLDALEALDVAPEAQSLMNDTGQVDVEEVFAKFKEGVQKTLSVDDGKAHYDLGQAYREMGLLDDAITEFDTAARDPKLEVDARFLVGMIQTERGMVKEAIAAYQKALSARIRTPEQETILCFEIGAGYETLRMPKEALSFFQRVVRRDPGYRDVQERIRRLSQTSAKPAVRAVAVGAEDDEFDRAFDELLGSDGTLGKGQG